MDEIEKSKVAWIFGRKLRIKEREDFLQEEFDYAYKQIEKGNEPIKELKHRINRNRNEIRELIKEYLNVPLYFYFGKYKGRIVQNIYEEDKQYCEWFKNNVVGNDYNTLVIIDYIVKKGNRNISQGIEQARLKFLTKYIKSSPVNYIEPIEEYTRNLTDDLYYERKLCKDDYEPNLNSPEDDYGAWIEAGEIF